MKKILLLILIACFSSCQDNLINDIGTNQVVNNPSSRSAFNGYFDWDRIDHIETMNPFVNKQIPIDLPWEKGSTMNLGISSEWLDENYADGIHSNRYYARENGWELIYSNIHKNSANKYFALYNKYTGILRFFFYEISASASSNSNETFWGIRIDHPTHILNFMDNISLPADSYGYLSYIASTEGTYFGDKFVSKGYKPNNWYGLEIECAYDPELTTQDQINFEVRGWCVNKITTTGTAETTGDITGTIEMHTNAPNFNFNLSNRFNNYNTNIKVNQSGFINSVGQKMQEGVNKKDSFWKGLWNSIRSSAMSGVKDGLKSIIKSGGASATKVLGKVMGSIIGIGGNKPSIGQINLKLKTNSKINLESEQELVGWGQISSFPVAGTTNNPNDMPLYNEVLGVWNLKESPKVIRNISGKIGKRYDAGIFTFHYNLDNYEVLINPTIKDEFTVQTYAYLIYQEERDFSTDLPTAFIDNKQYYRDGVTRISSYEIYGDEGDTIFRDNSPLSTDDMLLQVYVELTKKNNPAITYSFMKYFPIGEIIEGEENITEVNDEDGPLWQ